MWTRCGSAKTRAPERRGTPSSAFFTWLVNLLHLDATLSSRLARTRSEPPRTPRRRSGSSASISKAIRSAARVASAGSVAPFIHRNPQPIHLLWEDGPMTLDESVHGMRLRVIERAQVQGNVSAVCRELGISRTIFYRWRQRLERYGIDGVHPRRQRAQAGRPVATAPEVERLVVAIAISAATWGSRRIAAYLARTWRIRVAPSTVQRLLRRVGLATRRARLTVLEQQAARTAGLLTERTRPRLWRARYGRTRHVAATEPGELVCLDTFYIGNLKGIGKVWQITACHAASSYGVAALLPTHTAADAAA